MKEFRYLNQLPAKLKFDRAMGELAYQTRSHNINLLAVNFKRHNGYLKFNASKLKLRWSRKHGRKVAGVPTKINEVDPRALNIYCFIKLLCARHLQLSICNL